LVFGKNDGRPGIGQVISSAHLKSIANGTPAGNDHLHETVECGS